MSSTAAFHNQINTFHYDPNLCPNFPPLTSMHAEIQRSRHPQGSCEPSRPDPATPEPLVPAAMKLQTGDEQLIDGTHNQHPLTSQLTLKVHSRAHMVSSVYQVLSHNSVLWPQPHTRTHPQERKYLNILWAVKNSNILLICPGVSTENSVLKQVSPKTQAVSHRHLIFQGL